MKSRLIDMAQAFARRWAGQNPDGHTIRIFRTAVYAWCLLHTALLLPVHDLVWGARAYVPSVAPKGVLGTLTNLLQLPSLAPYYPLLLILQIGLLLIGLTGYRPRTVALLVYLCTFNLDNKAYTMLDGGDNLMSLMLFYLIFMKPAAWGATTAAPATGLRSGLGNSLSNSAFWMARIQLCLVYFVAGTAKATGQLWQKGTALYYTLHVDTYSMPLAQDLISATPALSVLGSYATVLFQLAFPWLIWVRGARPVLFAIGTGLHLSISLVMGLLTFGLAMAISYILFYDDEWSRGIVARVSGFTRAGVARAAAAARAGVAPFFATTEAEK